MLEPVKPEYRGLDRRRRAGGHRRARPPLRVGVIGAGTMGSHHARVFASLGGLCELHGVFDAARERAEAVARRHETRAYSDVDHLLADVDAVSIASPSRFHVDQAIRALQAGVHALVEKPVALDVAEARRLQAVAEQVPACVLQVGHIEHFNPAIGVLRTVLADESVIALDVQRLSPFDGRITDTDVVQDLMLHDLHVVLSIARARLRQVQAAGVAVRSADLQDYAVAHLIFDDGMIASLSASRVTEEKIRRLTATTREEHVTMDYLHRTVEVCRWTRLESDRADARSYRQESVVQRIWVPQEEPLVAQLRSFLSCARDGGTPEVGIGMGVRCLEVVDQIREAAHRELDLPVAA